MAYIGNVVAFLEECLLTDAKYGLYNYVDTPDLTMNELVCQVKATLKHKPLFNIRLPYIFGLFIGYMADLVAKCSGRKLPISAIRVKKFTSSTQFKTNKLGLNGFVPPFELSRGIQRTIHSEFIEPDPKQEIFYTE
jgi:GlcNAc-P-P-Und epimerase